MSSGGEEFSTSSPKVLIAEEKKQEFRDSSSFHESDLSNSLKKSAHVKFNKKNYK